MLFKIANCCLLSEIPPQLKDTRGHSAYVLPLSQQSITILGSCDRASLL